MKNIVMLLVLSSNLVFSQKQDYNWVWGGNRDGVITAAIMNFSNEKRYIDTFVFDLKTRPSQVNASISDAETGELLFYTNGCVIANADHEVMEGGDSINYDAWMYKLQADCEFGYPFPQNTFIVPDPGYDGGYYVIHKPGLKVEGYPMTNLGFPELWKSYVDMNLNSGKGKVIYKNQKVFKSNNTLSGYNHVVRHANGKDWWFIQMEDTTNLHYTLLIDEAGINLVDTFSIGPAFQRNSSSGGQAKFSPDGSKWARASMVDGLSIFNFDRNTGELTLHDHMDINHWFVTPVGMEWSPSGQFLYLSLQDTLYQLDTWQNNLENGLEVIGIWDGTLNPFHTVFGFMQLGPDCRIYMSSYSSTKTIHVINNPDGLGVECDFRQHGLDLLGVSTGTVSMPNFPNFRLGIGPPCNPDIQTSTGLPIFQPLADMKIYPNPSSTSIYLQIEQDEWGTLSIFDQQGKIVYNRYLYSSDEVAVSQFSQGLYVVRFVGGSGRAYVDRVMVGS